MLLGVTDGQGARPEDPRPPPAGRARGTPLSLLPGAMENPAVFEPGVGGSGAPSGHTAQR